MWIFFTIALGLDIFLGISCTLQFCHRALAHESQSNTLLLFAFWMALGLALMAFYYAA
ncbi:MAG: hypothetical protein H9901_03045 [Candidatus Paralactobacillus gallistercoris]|uniref:Uncharacterized protein n=1 Tax=Candidatus Paralactobacillus gallistercoris TaxID=2838724 RepID=A0A948X338_9LACO|nr:hypothetical protein [Candidatus Paralactobacillus gallistercoris]